MNAANAIIEKILSDAQNKADLLVSETKTRAADKLRDAKKEVEKQEEETLAKAKLNVRDLKARKVQLAAIEQKKTDLIAKRAILDDVFKEARAEILKSKGYKNLIRSLVTKHCCCDACIVVSKHDEKVLTAAFIKTCSTKCKFKFTRRVTDSFEGGIIIESEKYDIHLTLDDVIATTREQIEKQVAELVWG